MLCFQDAKKGVLFIDFPPVLQLQLKRFEYDFMRDTMVKVSIWSSNDPNKVSTNISLWVLTKLYL